MPNNEMQQVAPVFIVKESRVLWSRFPVSIGKETIFMDKELAKDYINTIAEYEKELFMQEGHSLADWKNAMNFVKEENFMELSFSSQKRSVSLSLHEITPADEKEIREEIAEKKRETDAMKEEFWDLYT